MLSLPSRWRQLPNDAGKMAAEDLQDGKNVQLIWGIPCPDEWPWARLEVPRLTWVCQLCGAGTVGDERHLVFECPALACCREKWSHLFEGPQTMQAFMWQENLIGLAMLVNACLHEMNPSPTGQTSDQPGMAGRNVI